MFEFRKRYWLKRLGVIFCVPRAFFVAPRRTAAGFKVTSTSCQRTRNSIVFSIDHLKHFSLLTRDNRYDAITDLIGEKKRKFNLMKFFNAIT